MLDNCYLAAVIISQFRHAKTTLFIISVAFLLHDTKPTRHNTLYYSTLYIYDDILYRKVAEKTPSQAKYNHYIINIKYATET